MAVTNDICASRPSEELARTLLEEQLAVVERRLEAHGPLVAERAELVAAIAALDGDRPGRSPREPVASAPGAPPRYSDADLLAALRRCAAEYQADLENGRIERRRCMNGAAPGVTYYGRWRGRQPDRDRLPSEAVFQQRAKWSDWSRRAGLEPNEGVRRYEARYDEAALIAALRRCASDYRADIEAGRVGRGGTSNGSTPGHGYYTEWRKRQPDCDDLPSASTFVQQHRPWSSWSERAGLAPNLGTISADECLAWVRRAREELGRRPTREAYRSWARATPGAPRPSTVISRFGTWSNVVAAARKS